jgi:hypothetical protein
LIAEAPSRPARGREDDVFDDGLGVKTADIIRRECAVTGALCIEQFAKELMVWAFKPTREARADLPVLIEAGSARRVNDYRASVGKGGEATENETLVSGPH